MCSSWPPCYSFVGIIDRYLIIHRMNISTAYFMSDSREYKNERFLNDSLCNVRILTNLISDRSAPNYVTMLAIFKGAAPCVN